MQGNGDGNDDAAGGGNSNSNSGGSAPAGNGFMGVDWPSAYKILAGFFLMLMLGFVTLTPRDIDRLSRTIGVNPELVQTVIGDFRLYNVRPRGDQIDGARFNHLLRRIYPEFMAVLTENNAILHMYGTLNRFNAIIDHTYERHTLDHLSYDDEAAIIEILRSVPRPRLTLQPRDVPILDYNLSLPENRSKSLDLSR